MSYTNSQQGIHPGRRLQACRAALCFAALCLSLPPMVLGQDHGTDAAADFSSMADLFMQLDTRAEDCLATLPDASNTEVPAICIEFISRIDGQEVADYLRRCQELRQWRDEFVSTNRQANVDSLASGELQQVLDIEFYCAERALLNRTEFVARAFAELQQTAGLRRRTSESNRQHSPIPRSLNPQSSAERVRQETNALWRQLEIENLRQEIRKP